MINRLKQFNPVLSRRQSFKSLSSISRFVAGAFGVLLWSTSAVHAGLLSGSKNTGTSIFKAAEDINLLIECSWVKYGGEFTAEQGDPTAVPPTFPTVTQRVDRASCVGYKADSYSPGNGTPYNGSLEVGVFEFQVVYKLPTCVTSDKNKGHGNETCVQYDPDNTGNGGSSEVDPGRSGVSCEEVSGDAVVSYTAFCEEGVVVDPQESYLTFVVGEGTPPSWTNCAGDNTNCTLVLGGLPHTTKGKKTLIDSGRCKELFPADGVFEEEQILTYKERYSGATCEAALSVDIAYDPFIAQGRFCDSGFGTDGWDVNDDSDAIDDSVAGFDNYFRECPSTISALTGEVVNHTASYEVTAFQFEVVAEFKPESYNLNSCPDEGQVNVQLSTQGGLDVTRIAGLDPTAPKGIDEDFMMIAPQLFPFNADTGLNDPSVDQGALGVPPESANFSDSDFDGSLDTVKLSYKTCGDGYEGLTEIIEANPAIIVEDGSKLSIDVTLQGTTTGGTEFGASDYDHKVVVPF